MIRDRKDKVRSNGALLLNIICDDTLCCYFILFSWILVITSLQLMVVSAFLQTSAEVYCTKEICKETFETQTTW